MKNIEFLTLVSVALVGLALPASAGPRGGGVGFGGGGGGHIGGGGRVGGFAGGGFRAAPAFYGGGFRAAPTSGGAYFTGRSVNRPSAAPQFYYGGTRSPAVAPRGFPRSVGQSMSPYVGRSAAATRQQPNSVSSTAARSSTTGPRVSNAANRRPNRVGLVAGRNQVSDQRTSTAAKRQSFVRDHASEQHVANWHRDWDRHHAHFHDHKVFVFIGGFWWGLTPAFYSDYASGDYPYDNSYDYPYDSSAYPYDGAEYSPSQPYSYYDGYAPSGQYSNTVVSAVQSKLADLGYYHGAIDGNLGDESEAALARYQQDQDLSVTGTVTSATLQALGLPYSGGL